MRPLYTPINEFSSQVNAPLLPPDEMAQVLVYAVAWAKDRGTPMYCYQLWHGEREGWWTCGAFLPADDPYLRVEPNGEVWSGCDHCDPLPDGKKE